LNCVQKWQISCQLVPLNGRIPVHLFLFLLWFVHSFFSSFLLTKMQSFCLKSLLGGIKFLQIFLYLRGSTLDFPARRPFTNHTFKSCLFNFWLLSLKYVNHFLINVFISGCKLDKSFVLQKSKNGLLMMYCLI